MNEVIRYNLNMAYNQRAYDSIIESVNYFFEGGVINEGITDIPLNKIKDLSGKIKSVIDSGDKNKIESFAKSHKNLAMDPKKLRERVYKIGRELGHDEAQLKSMEQDFIKSLGAVWNHLSIIILLPLALFLLLIVILTALLRGKSIGSAFSQINKEFNAGIIKDSKATYSISNQIQGTALLISLFTMFVSIITLGLGGIFMAPLGIVASALAIISFITFILEFATTGFRV